MLRNKQLKYLIIALLISMFLVSCDETPQSTKVISSNISVKKARLLIEENQKNPDFVILDLRTPQETVQGVIKGARQIDYMKSDFVNKVAQLDKTKTYLIYCQSGYRSDQTIKLMKKKKFLKVYNMFRGFIGWRSNGYSFVYP